MPRDKLIKIIQINSSADFGGGSRVMYDIIEGLRHFFQFIVVIPPGHFLRKYSKERFKIEKLKSRNPIGVIKKLKAIILRENPDILHAHGTRTAFWTKLAVIGLKKKPKIIYTLHGFHIVRRPFFIRVVLLFLERFLNHWINVLVCVSEADKNLVFKYKTISPEKIRIIRNGIDIKKFQISKDIIQRTKKELKLESKFILCSVGRLHPQKDFSTLLKALKLVVSEIENVKLLIVGDGLLRKSLEEETKSLDLDNFVEFLGFRQDIPILISLSDIIILSTRWEGLPLVPLEVGACKKAVIASDIEGVRETIINRKTGYLFKSGSEKDLADKILKLYKKEELRKKIGENAFQFIVRNFNKDKMVQEYQNLYQSIL